MKKRIFAVIIAIVLCVGLMSGCGGGDTDSGSTTSTGGSEDSEVIKIGVILPYSGASSYVGHALSYGLEAAVKDFTEHYGDKLNGKTIELVKGDSASVPDTGVSEFERMVNNEGISAVVGTYNSNVGASIAPLAIKYKIPFMVTICINDIILAEDSNYVFRTNWGDAETAPLYDGFFKYLKEEKGIDIKNAAVVYEATDYGQGGREVMLNGIYPEAGINVVLDEGFMANSGDLSSIVNKIRASNADYVAGIMYDNDALTLTRQLAEYGVKTPVIGYGGGFLQTDYIEQSGDASNLIMSSASWFFDPSMLGEDALKIADEFAVTAPEYKEINESFASGFLGMYCLLDAIANTGGSSDPEVIANALNEFELYPGDEGDRALMFYPTMEGVKYGDFENRYNQNIYANGMIAQIQDGHYKVVYPGTDAIIWPVE